MNEFSQLLNDLGFTKETYAEFSKKSLNTIHRRTSNSDSHYPAPHEVVCLLRMVKNARSERVNGQGPDSKIV